jgi:uncharacterized RDD family membrane protein YckC
VSYPNDSAFAGAAAYPVEPQEPYAAWWRRVAAVLLDSLLLTPFYVVAMIGATLAADAGADVATQLTGLVIAGASYLGLLAFTIWNFYIRQGRRGASIGKACLGILVLSAASARPVGAAMTLVRNIAHLIDYLPLGLGLLWPLWDRRRQTFADKVANTVVLHLPDVRF